MGSQAIRIAGVHFAVVRLSRRLKQNHVAQPIKSYPLVWLFSLLFWSSGFTTNRTAQYRPDLWGQRVNSNLHPQPDRSAAVDMANATPPAAGIFGPGRTLAINFMTKHLEVREDVAADKSSRCASTPHNLGQTQVLDTKTADAAVEEQ